MFGKLERRRGTWDFWGYIFLLGNIAAGLVVYGIFLDGLDFKAVAPRCLLGKFRDDGGITF